MRMESNSLQVIYNAITSIWGGFILAIVGAFVYNFYCLMLMSFFMPQTIRYRYNFFDDIMGVGCFGFLVLFLLVIYCFKFAKNKDSRTTDICVVCMIVALYVFISEADMGVSVWRIVAYLIISLSTPLAVYWGINYVKRRQIRLLEEQADELERQRLLGLRNVESEEYRKNS